MTPSTSKRPARISSAAATTRSARFGRDRSEHVRGEGRLERESGATERRSRRVGGVERHLVPGPCQLPARGPRAATPPPRRTSSPAAGDTTRASRCSPCPRGPRPDPGTIPTPTPSRAHPAREAGTRHRGWRGSWPPASRGRWAWASPLRTAARKASTSWRCPLSGELHDRFVTAAVPPTPSPAGSCRGERTVHRGRPRTSPSESVHGRCTDR